MGLSNFVKGCEGLSHSSPSSSLPKEKDSDITYKRKKKPLETCIQREVN